MYIYVCQGTLDNASFAVGVPGLRAEALRDKYTRGLFVRYQGKVVPRRAHVPTSITYGDLELKRIRDADALRGLPKLCVLSMCDLAESVGATEVADGSTKFLPISYEVPCDEDQTQPQLLVPLPLQALAPDLEDGTRPLRVRLGQTPRQRQRSRATPHQ